MRKRSFACFALVMNAVVVFACIGYLIFGSTPDRVGVPRQRTRPALSRGGYDLGNIRTLNDAFFELGRPLNTTTSPLPPGYLPLICDSIAQCYTNRRVIWVKDREYITIEYEVATGQIVTIHAQKRPLPSWHPAKYFGLSK